MTSWKVTPDRYFTLSQLQGPLPNGFSVAAIGEISQEQAGNFRKFSGHGKLGEHSVNPVGRFAHILEEKNCLIPVWFKRCAQEMTEVGQIAAPEASLCISGGKDFKAFGPDWLGGARVGNGIEQAVGRLAIAGAEGGNGGAVKGDQVGPLTDGTEQDGEVAEPDQDLGLTADQIHVEAGCHSQRAIAAAGSEEGFYFRVCPEGVELVSSAAVCSGQIAFLAIDIPVEFDLETHLFDQADSGGKLFPVANGASGSNDADGVAAFQA